MKKWAFLLLLLPQLVVAQTPRLGTLTPAAEAALRVYTASGASLPRFTAAQRRALPAPRQQQVVFQVDGTAGLYYYSGQEWVNVTTGRVPDAAGYCGPDPAREVRTVAGMYRAGRADGPADKASFYSPYGLALDRGMLYVAENENHCIRQIELATGQVSTVAGCPAPKGSYCRGGFRDGIGRAAEFNEPLGVAADGRGNLYVADSRNHRIRRIVLATGAVSTLAGSGERGALDGAAREASFNNPLGVAADSAGNVYVADTYNSLIRRIDGTTGQVSTLAGRPGTPQGGLRDGLAAEAQFMGPVSLALDHHGSLFVADRDNNRVRRIRLATGAVSTLAAPAAGEPGERPAVGVFPYCSGVAADRQGHLIVTGHRQVQCLTVATEAVNPLAGAGETPGYIGPERRQGPAPFVRLDFPVGAAVADDGTVYLADYEANAIVAVLPADTARLYQLYQRVAHLEPAALQAACLALPNPPDRLALRGRANVLAGVPPAHPGGIWRSGPFKRPEGIAVGPAGVVYVADADTHSLYRVAVDGRVSLLAGSGQAGYANGLGRAARFNQPQGLAVGADGTVYVADVGNNCIRQVSPTGQVRTLAGSPQPGKANGVGALAHFRRPLAVAVGADGSVYVADQGNGSVRRIWPGGRVSTVVAPMHQDNSGDRFQVESGPAGLAVGPGDTVFVSNLFDHQLHKITPRGRVLPLAGSSEASHWDGQGEGAGFTELGGVAVSATGTVYVSEPGSGSIRRVTPDGWAITVAGTRAAFLSPVDQMLELPLYLPGSVAVGPDGALYIADAGNHCIRIIR